MQRHVGRPSLPTGQRFRLGSARARVTLAQRGERRLYFGKEGGRSNLPTGHASRGPATPVGIFPCFWTTEVPELTRASLRCARRASGSPGEPPARHMTETTLGRPFAAGAAHPRRSGGEFPTLRHRGAAAAVAVAAVALVALWHRSQQTLGVHYQARLRYYQRRAQRRGRSIFLCQKLPRGWSPTVPTAAAPSIIAPAAAASAMGAACSTVPSAANSLAGARLVDFAHGWYVKGQARALGVDLR